jgi:phosphoribosyl 1,2-cyclic phosphodiesterase
MLVGRERLIFDGGTGLRILGQSLLGEKEIAARLLFTHSHWDHIQGFPFFTPA